MPPVANLVQETSKKIMLGLFTVTREVVLLYISLTVHYTCEDERDITLLQHKSPSQDQMSFL